MITMDPWPQLVFAAADGQHTVAQLITHLGTQYEGGAPSGLAEQVEKMVETLVQEGIVRLSDKPVMLPPYYAEDYFAAPPETRAEQMRADGLIK